MVSNETSGILRMPLPGWGNSSQSRRSRMARTREPSSIIFRQSEIGRSSPMERSLQTWSKPT